MTSANGRKPKNIKHHNLRYILSIVKRRGVCTASEISGESNLSMTTIVKTLDSLKQAGIEPVSLTSRAITGFSGTGMQKRTLSERSD